MKFVTYEVYVMNAKGEWKLRSRFDAKEKQEAFDLGKNIEYTEKLATKIVKETYDKNTNENHNTVVYISPKIRHKHNTKNAKKYTGKGYKGEIPSFIYEEEQAEVASFGRVVWLFIFVLLVSFVLAALTAFASVFIISRYTTVSNEIGSQFVLGVFIFMFILTAVPMSKSFIPWHRLSRPEEEIYDPYDEEEKKPKISFGDKLQRAISEFLTVPEAAEPEPEEARIQEKKKPQLKKEESAVEKEFKTIFDTPNLDVSEDIFSEKKEEKPEERNDLEDLLDPKNDNSDEDKNKDDDAPPPEKVDEVYEGYKKQIMYFVKEVALILKSESLPITAFTKFGLNLLIVGAIDDIKEKGNISDDIAKKLLSDSLLLLGIQPHLAEMFYEKIESYTLNPSYLQMMQNGKSIMIAMISQSSDFQEVITSSFKDWLKPLSKEHDIITVMFTDITDSTAITAALGDEKGYHLVKAHNKIVRKALHEVGGREIKHTGDGIMASFLSASNAVQVAILIQRLVISYNKKNAELPLNLKIGLSSGEPVREGQDLFGATVQIASRLCSYAKPGQIIASKEVKELNQTLSDKFTKLGEEKLKGIQSPIEIYSIEYSHEESEDIKKEKVPAFAG